MLNRICTCLTATLLSMFVGHTVLAAGDFPLGPGDVIRISVFEHPDLETVDRVSESGDISFPLLGDVAAGGLTEAQLEKKLESLLQKQRLVQSPHVTVLIEQSLSHQVSVLGMVNKPGRYSIEPQTTIVDLLAMAGGIREGGSDRVIITTDQDGKQSRVSVDVASLLQSGNAQPNITVHDNDAIFVPRQDEFYVYGQVAHPGAFPLQSKMTVMQAISVSGGLTDIGTTRGLQIKRRNADGEVTTLGASLSDELQPDDVVLVKEGLF